MSLRVGSPTAEMAPGSAEPNPFAAYLPRLVVDWARNSPDARWMTAEATVAFVDISGFTKLSERLAKHGKIGAEELSDAIGSSFVHLLAVAYANGGNLIKFGGDALLLLFSGQDHSQRACRAAVGMRKELRSLRNLSVLGNRAALRMSVGINTGEFQFFLVGDSHRELVVTGPSATATVSMEQSASAGEIVVSRSTASALAPGTVGDAKDEGFLLRRAPGGFSEHAPLDEVGTDIELAGYVPLAIRDAVATEPIAPEHRRVTVAFIRYEGTDELMNGLGSDATCAQIDDLICDVQRAADRHGVAFLGTDIDADGGKVILSAGAPSTTGDDEHRMLLCVREVVDTPRAIPVRVGVNRGFVFAGEIGPHYRRTFTVMGDVVNLAARLMAKAAPGQVLTTPDVVDRVHAEMDLTPLEPFFVKGKSKAIDAFAVESVAGVRSRADEGTEERSPFVGREDELSALIGMSRSVGAGKGTVVELIGEPGVGKSRLIEELSGGVSMRRLSMTCEPYETSTPYYPFRSLVRGLLGLARDVEGPEERNMVRDVLALVSPELVAWAPLVGAVAGVRIAETDETAQLEDRFRPRKLADVTIQLLAALLDSPTLIVVEDAQWIDDASFDLLRRLAFAATTNPWLVVVAGRDGQTESLSDEEEDLVVSLRIPPLSPSAATELVRRATRVSPVPAHTTALLVERSGGNPLFLNELLATALAKPNEIELPETVDAVIATRIDLLSPSDRHFLRRVSVLGRGFPSSLLPAVLEEGTDDEDLHWRRLADFIQRDGETLSFRNALVRDSAYAGLPYRLRQQLHARVADRIRERAGPDPGDQAGLLSLHYLQAHRYEEAWKFSLIAAGRAKDIHAHVESAELYERAVESARHVDSLTRPERMQVWEELGDARNRSGIYAGADKAYRSARSLTEDPVVMARLALKLAQVCGWLDRYSGALRWISRGLRILEEVNLPEAPALRSQLLAWYGRFCQEEGHHKKAIRWGARAVDAAEAAGNADALANALKVLDWAEMDLGNLERPDNWERALGLFEGLGDLPSQASVLNMMGGFAYFEGRWGEALDLYRRAQSIVLRTGNDVMDAFCRNNIGEIALEQGHLDEAESEFEEARRIWLAAGYRSVAATAVSNLARVACARENFEEAITLFEDSLAEAQRVGGHTEYLEVNSRLAECLLLSGRFEDADRIVEEGIEQCKALGGVPSRLAHLQRLRAASLMMRESLEDAGEALESSLQAGRARNADYEVALTLRILCEWHTRTGSAVPDAIREESNAVLERLGVVWVQDLL